MIVFVGLHIPAAFLAKRPLVSQVGVTINALYENWVFQIFIFFCLFFHAINILRIVILDLWPKLIECLREAIWLE